MRLKSSVLACLAALLPFAAAANYFESYYEVRCLPEVGVLDVRHTSFRGRPALNAADTPDALAKLETLGIYHRSAGATCAIGGKTLEWKVAFSPSDCRTGQAAAIALDLTVDGVALLKALPIGYQKHADGGLGQIEQITYIPNYDAGVPELWFYGFWKPGSLSAENSGAPLDGAWLSRVLAGCTPGANAPCHPMAENVWPAVEAGLCAGDASRKANALTCARFDLMHAQAEIDRYFHQQVGQMDKAEQGAVIERQKAWEKQRDATCKRQEGTEPDLRTVTCLARETRAQAAVLKSASAQTPMPPSTP